MPKHDMICPHCLGYFTYCELPEDDVLICPICNNKIEEEDIDDVFAQTTARVSNTALSSETTTEATNDAIGQGSRRRLSV